MDAGSAIYRALAALKFATSLKRLADCGLRHKLFDAAVFSERIDLPAAR
jgi:hypothetical protein